MNIEMKPVSSLRPAPWAACHILKPDAIGLERSLSDYGWLQPIVVQSGTNMIIDGHARIQVVRSSFDVRKKEWANAPCVVAQCDDIDAMLMHLRLNRMRGAIVAKRMSTIIRDILRSRRYSEVDLKRLLVMKADEMDLMVDGSLIKMRKITEHEYSRAWVPVEAPASIRDSAVGIERPPNADR